MSKNKIVLALFTIFSVLSFSDLKVSDIKINNLQDLTEEYIKNQLPIKVGDGYSNKILSDIYTKLKDTGLITNVVITPEINNENVILKLNIDEQKNAKELLQREEAIKEAQKKTEFIIKSVEIKGNKNIDLSTVKDELPLKVGENFVPFNVELAARQIFSTGYFKEVEPQVLRTADGKNVDIIFNLVENPVVKSISISGSELFLERDLIEKSKIKVGEVLNLNLINPETMPLLDVYKQNGVLSAGLQDIKISENGDVTIILTEGKIGEVKVKKIIQRKDGERRSSDKYNLKTKDFVFNRALSLKSGDVLTQDAINKSLNDLYKTGLFTSLTPNFISKDGNITDIEILVAERPTTSINASLSYTSTEGIIGGIKLSDANFLGQAQELGVNLEFGTRGNFTGEFSFFDPWIRGTDRIQAGGSISFNKQRAKDSDMKKLQEEANDDTLEEEAKLAKQSELKNKEYVKYVTTVSGTIGKGIYDNLYITLKPSLQLTSSRNYENEKRNDYKVFSITPSIIYDTRDNSFIPKKGVYLQFSNELGYIYSQNTIEYVYDSSKKDFVARENNSTGLYNKVDLDLKFYHPVYKDKNSMAYRLNIGASAGLVQESFSNNDGTIFRGINDSISGKEKFIVSIENRTYISDYIQGILFFDAGNIYNPENRKQAWTFENFKKSFGVGARINTPIGVIRLDYGWPIIKSEYTNNYKVGRGRLSFGFGQTF